jgi:hypothetical protein
MERENATLNYESKPKTPLKRLLDLQWDRHKGRGIKPFKLRAAAATDDDDVYV